MRQRLSARMRVKTVFGPGCWGWTGATDAFGYGVIGVGRRGEGTVLAHRQAWEFNFGPIPDGLCVLHHCDNPPCTNPDHLWLGTRDDNNRDMTEKGRARRNQRPSKGEPYAPAFIEEGAAA